jgi:tripartite-type tricarboxylate transporter receptor subunit TctC
MRRTTIARSPRLMAAAIAAACITPALPAQAQSVAEFYSKNPVQLLIGFPAGNAYDTYGRAVARHLGRHIPGNPNIVVVNRPGAGSLTSANFLYNGAPKNGSTIATFNRSVPLDPLMGNATARFDPRKFYWLGSVGNEVSVCVSWHTSAVKTFDDLISKDFVLGATSFSADTGIYPLVLRNVFDAKLKIITGYPGGGEINLAMENGELQGRCGWSWSGVKSQRPAWLRDRQISVLVQMGLQKADDLPDVPLILDVAKSAEQRKILEVINSRQEFAWPFAAPPDIPADRARALRDAFAATMKDPEFLADAKKIHIDVNPIAGAAVEKLINDVYSTPEAILTKVRSIVTTQ